MIPVKMSDLITNLRMNSIVENLPYMQSQVPHMTWKLFIYLISKHPKVCILYF